MDLIDEMQAQVLPGDAAFATPDARVRKATSATTNREKTGTIRP